MPAPIFDFSVDDDGHGNALVSARGELDIGNAEQLEKSLAELAGRHATVLLDLRELTFMDSTGVRVLLQTAEDARRDGWTLRMRAPADGEALMTLQETGVLALLPLEDQQA